MNPLLRILARQWFMIGVACVISLGYVAPGIGQWLDAHFVPNLIIIVIFFTSGLAIRLKHIGEGLLHWRCHLLIQSLSFLLAPALVWAAAGCIAEGPVRLGAFLVAALPTTIFSCVAFTAASGGNAACAILNAVGGNLAGVALSPLLLGLLSRSGGGLDVATIERTIADLCLLVLLPLIAGQVIGLRPSALRDRISKRQSYIGMSCVLMVMFCAFSKSIGELASQLNAMWRCFLFVAALHGALLGAGWGIGRLVRLEMSDRIAALFCGSQKTLSLGVPLAYSYYRGTATPVGIVVLPLVFYHLLELTAGSVIVARFARAKEL